MSRNKTLPALDEAVGVAAGCAAAMSEVARAEYSEDVVAAIEDVDRRLGEGVVADPATFAHEAAGSYLIAAGDFVCGIQYVVNPKTNLLFSSSALARSACEFSNRAWWLADPEITEERRIARAIAVVRNTINEESVLLEPATLANLQNLARDLERCQQVHRIETARLPTATQLFLLANPETGQDDFKHLCNATHGSFFTVLTGHHAATTGTVLRQVESWWRVLTACRYGLNAAERICELQGNDRPQSLLYASAAYLHYTSLCSQWEDTQQ